MMYGGRIAKGDGDFVARFFIYLIKHTVVLFVL